MDKLVETSKERFWNHEAWVRDTWIQAEAAKLPAGSRVLDAGAGASKYRPFFAHCRYETQDFCQYQGKLVKYLQPIDYVCDITRIPLPDGSLDAILCTEVLEHVTDPMAVLTEFARLVKPGGRLLLTAPHGTTLHMQPYHFYGGFTHYWYRHWLPRHGFVVDSILPQGGPGRATVCYLHAFYTSWRAREQKLKGLKRASSLAARMAVKLPIHYLLTWMLPKFDPYLDSYQICVGLMVAATRVESVPRPAATVPDPAS
ncbi:MAG TPA: class I SAM-dependent methyltransferase [Candidatus Binatia bacterium]|jgi:SAM-dependent methyltransferase|nr:class I SAM-dependent methyltransferase [Candidatus Binatia bacterium]